MSYITNKECNDQYRWEKTESDLQPVLKKILSAVSI